jgi:transcriptional regulator with XRE-family HTH domain
MDNDEAQLRREIGKRFRKARQAARNGQGFTQAEVGAILGKGDGTVSTWEIGRSLPDAMTLRWMAQNYGVSVDELLLLKAPEEPAAAQPQPATEPQPAHQSTSVRRPDTFELSMPEFVRVIQRAVASGLSDEREVRAFLNGVLAGVQVNGER